jgi:hypothetical protein
MLAGSTTASRDTVTPRAVVEIEDDVAKLGVIQVSRARRREEEG